MTKKYKIKSNFLLKTVAGESIVVARGPSAIDFGGVLVLNESCALLWKLLKFYRTKEELCEELIKTYGISEDTAANDVETCIQKMLEYNLLDKEK